MLILSRRPGEALLLDGDIRIEILSTDGRTVRIGIEAPAEVRILRSEIVASVEEETRRAAQAAAHWVAAAPSGPPRARDLSAPSAPRVARPPATEA